MIPPMKWIGLLIVFVSVTCLAAADPAAREKELAYLRCLIPDDLLPHAHLEVPGIENIRLEGEAADQHLVLRVFPGQRKRNGGTRAEVSVDYPFKPGDRVRYSWKFMIPPDFQSDAPKNRWCLIGQWHDQPDETRGETWDNFPSRSPTVLIGLGELDGKPALGINYGLDQSQQFGPVFLKPGTWHSLAVVIQWSQQEDGKATFYFDDMGKPLTTITGANMHNGYQHFLKLGMYRHPEIATDNSIHLDSVAITHETPE